MLRLWPDKVARLSLYADGFRCGGESLIHPGGGDDLLANAFAHVRERHPNAKNVVVTVSDGFGVATAMPWQNELSRPIERLAYARTLLQQLGGLPEERWVVHGAYRHYGKPGLAYGFDKLWLKQVASVAADNALTVRHLIPFGALAYHSGPGVRVRTFRLIADAAQVTGLLLDRDGLIEFDAVIAAGDIVRAVLRLATRWKSQQMPQLQLACHLGEPDLLCQSMERVLPELRCTTLPLGYWESWQ